MVFGYALLGALVLLLPGFAGYYGMRVGEAGFVSPRPDRPNSNQTIFAVVLYALLAHTAGAAVFGLNELVARRAVLIALPQYPNPYRLLWGGVPAAMSGAAFAGELLYFSALTLGSFALCRRLAVPDPVNAATAPLRFGWLLPVARQVEAGSHVVIGHVMTTLGHDGAWIAYEGMVRRLALDDDAIEMIVLEQCDRFVVRIVDGRVERVDSDQRTIELIQLRHEQVANWALEVIEVIPGV